MLSVRRLAQLLKKKIPDTYDTCTVVRTQFGDMPMEKEKGEGGASSLERRLANQFYNKYIRLALVHFLFKFVLVYILYKGGIS